jgi:P4 family phage/plasmid primase-like protien
MEYGPIKKLAEQGFLFSPTSMGMTRSNHTEWQNIATNDLSTLRQWIADGLNLVSVAKHGQGFLLDIDDISSAVAKGFDMAWLDGYYLVDSPSGGLHAHGLHSSETEAMGNLVVVREVKGDKESKKIVELKLHNQSVAAPTAIRLNQPKKLDGEYLPRGPVGEVKRGLCPEFAAWLVENREESKPSGSYSVTTTEFHPSFDTDEFLNHHNCTEDKRYRSDGSLWVVVETCPLCDKGAKNTTGKGGVTKFIFGGRGYGFVCHACGVNNKVEFEQKMAEEYDDWERWSDFIYRGDDVALVEQDIRSDPSIEWLGDDETPAGGSEPQAESSETEDFSLEQQDTGNGERLVRNFEHLIRWVVETNEWMVWGKNGWRPDTKGTLMQLSKKVVEELEAEAKEAMRTAGSDEDAQKAAGALMRHARNSGSIPRRQAMIVSAGYEKQVITNFNDWDSDGWLFNCKNGVIDLKTQTFRERRREDLCMRQSPVVYDSAATCPVWEAAMDKWMCGDKELVAYQQSALGVTLTSDTSLQALFFNQGPGANGKDTMFTAFEYVMGDYWRNVDFMTFAETKNHTEHRNDLAVLAGAVRMVTAAESSDGHTLDEGIIKLVTGCSPVTCRHIHGKPFTYIPQYKLWVMSNYDPVIKGSDWGIWRRVKKIPWNYTVTEEEKDKILPEKLKAEASGILNWALAGLKWYVENGYKLPPCKAVEDATAKYRKDMDIIGRFADDCVCFKPTAVAMGPEIYKAYSSWCRENGTLAMSSRRFYAEWLKQYPQLTKRSVSGGARFEGVGLLIDGRYPDAEMAD